MKDNRKLTVMLIHQCMVKMLELNCLHRWQHAKHKGSALQICFSCVGWKSTSQAGHRPFPACHLSCRSKTSPSTVAGQDSNRMRSPARQVQKTAIRDIRPKGSHLTCCFTINTRKGWLACQPKAASLNARTPTHRQNCDPSFHSQSIAKSNIIFFAALI